MNSKGKDEDGKVRWEKRWRPRRRFTDCTMIGSASRGMSINLGHGRYGNSSFRVGYGWGHLLRGYLVHRSLGGQAGRLSRWEPSLRAPIETGKEKAIISRCPENLRSLLILTSLGIEPFATKVTVKRSIKKYDKYRVTRFNTTY